MQDSMSLPSGRNLSLLNSKRQIKNFTELIYPKNNYLGIGNSRPKKYIKQNRFVLRQYVINVHLLGRRKSQTTTKPNDANMSRWTMWILMCVVWTTQYTIIRKYIQYKKLDTNTDSNPNVSFFHLWTLTFLIPSVTLKCIHVLHHSSKLRYYCPSYLGIYHFQHQTAYYTGYDHCTIRHQ